MAVASLQIVKPTLLSPVSISQSNLSRKSDSGKVFLRSRCFVRRKFQVCCGVQEGDKQSNGEEPPESLFMKELKRRGMTPTSLLEETSRTDFGLDDEAKLKEEDRGFSRRNAVSTEMDKSLANQRERSMALNSEGLEREMLILGSDIVYYLIIIPTLRGLIPRAKLLLTIGGTFFLGFWPLILITVGSFSALYFYFGPSFVHDGSSTSISPPQYVDPYALLEDERISQIARRVN